MSYYLNECIKLDFFQKTLKRFYLNESTHENGIFESCGLSISNRSTTTKTTSINRVEKNSLIFNRNVNSNAKKSNLKAGINGFKYASILHKLKYFEIIILLVIFQHLKTFTIVNAQTCNQELRERFEFDKNLFEELNMKV